MSAVTECTYRILHDRKAREAFLAGDFARAGIPQELHEDFAAVDPKELLRASEKVSDQLHAMLKSTYPIIFASWTEICPEDPNGRELVQLYAGSKSYEETQNFAWTEGTGGLTSAFPRFLEELSRNGGQLSKKD